MRRSRRGQSDDPIAPGAGKIGQVMPETSYTIVDIDRGFAMLCATRYSKPFPPGAMVGWVTLSDLNLLMFRNCR